jgi:hypothetical protein
MYAHDHPLDSANPQLPATPDTYDKCVNPLADWISSSVTVTGNPADKMLISTMSEKFFKDFKDDHGTQLLVRRSGFVNLANAYFKTCEGVQYFKKTSIKIDGSFKSARNILTGVWMLAKSVIVSLQKQ